MPEVLSGLSSLNPNAWWALLTLFIPFIIHLFSKSRGRLVQIGHIDLVRHARKLQVTELKLTQWILLLLRLAIFSLAVLVLVGLARAGLGNIQGNSIYLTPGWISHAGGDDFDEILAELDRTPEIRVFSLQPGFPVVSRQQLENGLQQQDKAEHGFNHTWALLAERLSLKNHRGDVKVYTTDQVLNFGPHKPRLPREVEWRIARPDRTPGPDHNPVRAMIVYDTDRAADASRLDAVLSTLRQYRLPALTWNSVASDRLEQAAANVDWLILLGDGAVESADVERLNSQGVILSDAGGNAPEQTNQLLELAFYPFTSFRLEQYTLPGTNTDDRVLLATASGQPLLQETDDGPTRRIRFNSRFDPQWNSLSRQLEFPELFLQLMSGDEQERLRYADARLGDGNLQATEGTTFADIPLPRRSLQGLLAAILALLWMTERWLSERNAREKR